MHVKMDAKMCTGRGFRGQGVGVRLFMIVPFAEAGKRDADARMKKLAPEDRDTKHHPRMDHG